MKSLVIVDMQNDFMPGGALAVPKADTLVPIINALISQFPLVIATQDWHPKEHLSFAANHPGKKPGDHVKLQGVDQILWPVHCVQNTSGAALVSTLQQEKIAHICYKGTDPNIDSYSAFFDNAHLKSTGLADYLQQHGVTDVYLVGVATDYCVLYSALDAIALGFKVHVNITACKPINLHPQDEQRAIRTMKDQGVEVLLNQVNKYQG